MFESAVHLSDLASRPKALAAWERQRNRRHVHWFVECSAEAIGAFMYTYIGMASSVTFTIGRILGIEGISSLFQIGLSNAIGIMVAILISGPTSGGHLCPHFTVVYIVFRGFPPLKGLRYIIAQIFGAYVASALVYSQYKFLIDEAMSVLRAAGKLEALQFTAQGPGGIFALYLPPGQSLGRVFLNEFVTNIFVGLTFWGVLDPSNPFITPQAAVPVVSIAYGSAIWGFGLSGVVLNTARDVGGRLFAMTIWGVEAAGNKHYAALAALTNIPAMLCAVLIYELFLIDSDRVVPRASLEFISLHANHKRYRQQKGSQFLDSSDFLENGAEKQPGSQRRVEAVP